MRCSDRVPRMRGGSDPTRTKQAKAQTMARRAQRRAKFQARG